MNPLHQRALKLANTYIESERHLIEVLSEIDAKKIWRALGYSSFFEYVSKGLGLSESQAYTLTSITRKCVQVPELKEAILNKQVSISNAKRLLPVINRENQSSWLDKAQSLSTRKLEREVVAVNPRLAVPEKIQPIDAKLSKMTLCISDETEALIKKAQNLISTKKKQNLNLEETLKAMAEIVIQKLDKVEIAKRNCAKLKSPKPAKTSRAIPHAVQHQVMLRDRGRCQAKLPNGEICKKTRFTELHHSKVPYSKGGIHHVNNLQTLCFSHHKAQHKQL